MAILPPPTPKEMWTANRLVYISTANWRPIGGLSCFPRLIMDIIRLLAVPLPSPFLFSYLILGDRLLPVYTWVFINPSFPFCLHLSIRKLSLKAKWLADAMSYEDFLKDHRHITEQDYGKHLSFEVKLSSLQFTGGSQ